MGLKQVLLSVFGLALSSFLAYQLNEEDMGIYFYISSVISLISILTLIGLPASMERSIALGYEGAYKKTVIIKLKLGFIGTFIFFFLALYDFYNGLGQRALLFLGIGFLFPFISNISIWDMLLVVKEHFIRSIRWNLLFLMFKILPPIILIWLITSNIFIVIFISYLFLAIANITLLTRGFSVVENSKEDPEILRYGKYLSLIRLLGSISNHGEKVLLGSFLGVGQLAVYSISVSFVIQLKNAFIQFSNYISKRLVKLERFSLNITLILLLLGVFISLFLYFSIESLTIIFFSEKYIASAKLAQVASLSFIFFPLNQIFSKWIIFQKEKEVITIRNIVIPIIVMILQIFSIILGSLKYLVFLYALTPLIRLIINYILLTYFRSKKS